MVLSKNIDKILWGSAREAPKSIKNVTLQKQLTKIGQD